MIEIRCFSSVDALKPFRDEINALNLGSYRPDPFSTLEFHEHYVQHDQMLLDDNGVRPCFLVAMKEGSLVGYLPLKQTSHRVFGVRTTKVTFFSVHDVDQPHLLARAECAQAVVEALYKYLYERHIKWGLLEFHQQASDSLLVRYSPKTIPRGYHTHHWASWSNWTIPIRWEHLEDYFKDLSKKFRSNVSRQMRSLYAAGVLEFIGSSDPEATPALLNLYLGIEPHSWKSKAGLSIGRDPLRIRYFRGLLAAEQPMRISILLLMLNGVPIAGLINGEYGKGLYALQVIYDDRLNDMSPGSAILLMGIRAAITGRYEAFNLLSGFDYFKNRWLAEATETRSTQIYRRSSPLFWRRSAGDQIRRILDRVKKSPSMKSNPIRKEAMEPKELSMGSAPVPKTAITAEEQSRIASLLSEARRGECQMLSAEELAAAMPFGMTRPL